MEGPCVSPEGVRERSGGDVKKEERTVKRLQRGGKRYKSWVGGGVCKRIERKPEKCRKGEEEEMERKEDGGKKEEGEANGAEKDGKVKKN